MKIAGVVVEYNPLHNGHLYHLQETKKKLKSDLLFAVMSGPFLQRGEPAILSKWRRAELALKAGIDLVIELPYAYATQRAEIFAWGAVSLLSDLGVTDLCFGSEEGVIDGFYQTHELLQKHHIKYNNKLRALMKEGNSYPKAQSLAFKSLSLNPKETVDLGKPNNILGFHYVEAALKLGGKMNVHTIQRSGAGYHETTAIETAIASATAIRRHLLENNGEWDRLENYVPSFTAAVLREAALRNELRSWEDYFPFLRYRLLTDSPSQLQMIYEAEEGLENRLRRAALKTDTFQAFMNTVKTKRYTWTRLQRLLTHVLTQATKKDMQAANDLEPPKYIRLLGMSEKGQHYLNINKGHFPTPIISRISKEFSEWLERDLTAAKCYECVPTQEKNEFEHTPIRLMHT